MADLLDGRFAEEGHAFFARGHGVESLLRAVSGLDRDDWSLTFAGEDTQTGALRTSVRTQLELAADGDPRVRFGAPDFEQHDVVVAPAAWDAWPAEALPGLAQNRPLVATPAAGHVDLLRGGGGRLAAGTSVEALAAAIEELLDDQAEVARLTESREPRRRFEQLADPDGPRAAYAGLAQEAAAVPSRRARRKEPAPQWALTAIGAPVVGSIPPSGP